jgi:hypothetical protein
MVLPGHLAGGYLATTIVLSAIPNTFTQNELFILYLIGILSGDFPDLDLVFFYLSKKIFGSKKENHRDFITHLPLFWMMLCAFSFALGYVNNSNFLMTLSTIILAGTFSHFLFDSIDYGIQWLKPFTKKRFCIFTLSNLNQFEIEQKNINVQNGTIMFYWNYLWTMYVKQPSFYAEIFVTLIAIIVFLK